MENDAVIRAGIKEKYAANPENFIDLEEVNPTESAEWAMIVGKGGIDKYWDKLGPEFQTTLRNYFPPEILAGL